MRSFTIWGISKLALISNVCSASTSSYLEPTYSQTIWFRCPKSHGSQLCQIIIIPFGVAVTFISISFSFLPSSLIISFCEICTKAMCYWAMKALSWLVESILLLFRASHMRLILPPSAFSVFVGRLFPKHAFSSVCWPPSHPYPLSSLIRYLVGYVRTCHSHRILHFFHKDGLSYEESQLQLCNSSLGWRSAYYIHATFGICVFILWLIFYRDDPQLHPSVSEKELGKIQKDKTQAHIERDSFVPYKVMIDFIVKQNNDGTFQDIIKNKVILIVWFNAFTEMTTVTLLLVYAPIYFHTVLGYDIPTTGNEFIIDLLFEII